MSEKDLDRELGDLLQEAHRADEPPPFRRVWSTAPKQSRWRRRRWLWAPAATAAAVLAIAGGIRIQAMNQHRHQSRQISGMEERDPLAFLLDIPGRELLRSVPTFDTKGEWP